MLNVVLLAIIFGAGLPLLYPSAAGVLLIRYWWDKVMLFRASAAPRLYQARMMDVVAKWLLAAVALNLVLACWMFSSGESFPNDWDRTLQKAIGISGNPPLDGSPSIGGRTLRQIGNRLSKYHVEPLFVCALGVIAALFCYGVWRLTLIVVMVVTCGEHGGGSASMDDIRIVQKRSVVEAATGSQCFLWGNRNKFARVNSEMSVKTKLKGDDVLEELDVEAQTITAKSDKKVARAMDAAVRFEGVEVMNANDDEFPGA